MLRFNRLWYFNVMEYFTTLGIIIVKILGDIYTYYGITLKK